MPVRIRPFRTPVRGHAFAPRPAELPDDGVVDAPVELRREPANPADPLAVAVYAVGSLGAPWRVGYLDRSVAARLAPRMDRGARFGGRVEGYVGEPDGRWVRPLLLVLPEDDATDAGVAGGDGTGGTLWGRPPGSRRVPVRGRG